jgi:hypothetical protein
MSGTLHVRRSTRGHQGNAPGGAVGGLAGYCYPTGAGPECEETANLALGANCNPYTDRNDGVGSLCTSGTTCALGDDGYTCKSLCNKSGQHSCGAGQTCSGPALASGFCLP